MITQAQRTIRSHLTLMQLSCLCCDQLFMYNKRGAEVIKSAVYPFVQLIFYSSTLGHGGLLWQDIRHFLYLTRARSCFWSISGILPERTDLEKSVSSDEEAILKTCKIQLAALHHVIKSHDLTSRKQVHVRSALFQFSICVISDRAE